MSGDSRCRQRVCEWPDFYLILHLLGKFVTHLPFVSTAPPLAPAFNLIQIYYHEERSGGDYGNAEV